MVGAAPPSGVAAHIIFVFLCFKFERPRKHSFQLFSNAIGVVMIHSSRFVIILRPMLCNSTSRLLLPHHCN